MAIGLLGSADGPGIFLLDAAGTVQQMWAAESDADWVSGDDAAGIVLRSPDLPTGVHNFTWVRSDGSGLVVRAQPFHSIHGVAGDAFGGLWWIETPQTELELWQLWHYDPATDGLALRLESDGLLFTAPAAVANPALVPDLLSASPVFVPGEAGEVAAVELIVDTFDRTGGAGSQGVFRFTVDIAGTAQGTAQRPRLLLPAESYRAPLRVSPDRRLLAFFAYDPAVSSLTSGSVRPANSLRLLDLSAPDANPPRTVYAAETEFEFLAPNLAWLTDDSLVLARGRFANSGGGDPDRFAIVHVELGSLQDAGANARSYVLPEGGTLTDFAACRDRETILMIVTDVKGRPSLLGWDRLRRPQTVYHLPELFTRTALCWTSDVSQ